MESDGQLPQQATPWSLFETERRSAQGIAARDQIVYAITFGRFYVREHEEADNTWPAIMR